MSLPPETPNIDRFRGWALTALYGAMTLFSLMLVLAAYLIYPSYQGDAVMVMGTGLISLATAIFSLRATLAFISAMRSNAGDPGVAFMPFIFMTLTILASSQVFGGM
ncbi:hypothetical protein [Kordiimonas aestuarii]|uniref:hypothetical protein n=1 Tax=Kordiimonas aestuarii TaxID=1005925 RepID=UPI0021CEE86F|nr:hypothetical protein [Kordiimonas aestuarii]